MNKFLTLIILLNISCTTMIENIPEAKKIPKILNNHNDERIDNYYWLRDDTRTNEDVISYLKQENECKKFIHISLLSINKISLVLNYYFAC